MTLNSIKQITLATMLLATQWLAAQNPDRAVIDKVVAGVGGEITLLSEIQEQVNYAKEQQPTLPPDFECEALQSILMQKLLVNQAKLDSIEVKDEDVENELDARVERLMRYFNQDEKALEEYYGQTTAQIKEQMRVEMRNQLLAQRMQSEITSKATVTPSEVQQFYKSIPKDSLPYFNAEVEIRELMYKPKVSAAERDKARQRCEELRTRIERGEDFAELAKKYSDDTGSGAEGGDLGWQKRGTFVPTFEAMCYKLEKNQLSPLVETEFGFHIIQMLERRGNLIHVRHILIKPEVTSADLDAAKSKLDSVRQLILKDSLPFGIAVKQFGDKDAQSFNYDGRVTNPRSGNTFFEMADLDTDIFFAIDGLKVGEVSEPVVFRSPDGSKYFRLIQLNSRSKPHRADLKQDYNKIQAAALEQKKSQYLDKWMLDRLRSTYISVDPMYEDCPNLTKLLEAAEGIK